jgi:hypothetical protein
MGTDYEEPRTARDVEMESEDDRQRENDYESLDAVRWAKEDQLPNGDIHMEDEQDDHTLVEDKPIQAQGMFVSPFVSLNAHM